MFTLQGGTHSFVVYCNVSRVCFYSVLMQNENVIAYASRKLIFDEKNYPTHDLELVEWVITLKIWLHCIYGVHVNEFTDHKSLQYMLTQSVVDLIRQTRCWSYSRIMT